MAFMIHNDVLTGDCVKLLARLPAGSVDLAFADPPFNIGYEYDVYQDRRAGDDYLSWSMFSFKPDHDCVAAMATQGSLLQIAEPRWL